MDTTLDALEARFAGTQRTDALRRDAELVRRFVIDAAHAFVLERTSTTPVRAALYRRLADAVEPALTTIAAVAGKARVKSEDGKIIENPDARTFGNVVAFAKAKIAVMAALREAGRMTDEEEAASMAFTFTNWRTDDGFTATRFGIGSPSELVTLRSDAARARMSRTYTLALESLTAITAAAQARVLEAVRAVAVDASVPRRVLVAESLATFAGLFALLTKFAIAAAALLTPTGVLVRTLGADVRENGVARTSARVYRLGCSATALVSLAVRLAGLTNTRLFVAVASATTFAYARSQLHVTFDEASVYGRTATLLNAAMLAGALDAVTSGFVAKVLTYNAVRTFTRSLANATWAQLGARVAYDTTVLRSATLDAFSPVDAETLESVTVAANASACGVPPGFSESPLGYEFISVVECLADADILEPLANAMPAAAIDYATGLRERNASLLEAARADPTLVAESALLTAAVLDDGATALQSATSLLSPNAFTSVVTFGAGALASSLASGRRTTTIAARGVADGVRLLATGVGTGAATAVVAIGVPAMADAALGAALSAAFSSTLLLAWFATTTSVPYLPLLVHLLYVTGRLLDEAPADVAATVFERANSTSLARLHASVTAHARKPSRARLERVRRAFKALA